MKKTLKRIAQIFLLLFNLINVLTILAFYALGAGLNSQLLYIPIYSLIGMGFPGGSIMIYFIFDKMFGNDRNYPLWRDIAWLSFSLFTTLALYYYAYYFIE